MTDTANFTESEKAFLSKAEQYCVAGEQYRLSVEKKLLSWGADSDAADKIIAHLCDNDFINEARYCRIYCESKLHLQKWGRKKIVYQLRMKGIDNAIINEAISNIDPEQYRDTLAQLAAAKKRTLHEADPMRCRQKLMAFLASHGFEMNEILAALQDING